MSKNRTSAAVIPFPGAKRETPPTSAPARVTVTIERGPGHRVQFFMEGDEQWCSGEHPLDLSPADWDGPEVRDLLILSHAQTFLGAMICEASDAGLEAAE